MKDFHKVDSKWLYLLTNKILESKTGTIEISTVLAEHLKSSLYKLDLERYVLTKRLKELELFKSEHLRLEAELNAILHPNGDGSTALSFCDLVSYIRNDITPKTRHGCVHE